MSLSHMARELRLLIVRMILLDSLDGSKAIPSFLKNMKERQNVRKRDVKTEGMSVTLCEKDLPSSF